MNKFLPILFFLAFFGMTAIAIASTNPGLAGTPQPALIYSPKRLQAMVFHGLIKRTADGTDIVLETLQSSYPLTGGDFAMIIGQEVNVIGRLVKDGKIEKIEVTHVQFNRG